MLFEKNLVSEILIKATRSSGAGGQNVNKVSTKVELRFHVDNSSILSDHEKEILREKLKSKLNAEGYLVINSQKSRSQLANKEDCIAKLYKIISRALEPPKARKRTRPTLVSKQKREEQKREHSNKKRMRKRPEY